MLNQEKIVPAVGYQGEIASKIEDFRKRGAGQAQRHLPSTDATHPDANEVGLRSDAERLVAEEQRSFNTEVTNSDRADAEIQRKLFDLDAQTQQALSDTSLVSSVDAELAGEKPRLVKTTEERIDAEVDWRAFRAKHQITNPAHYPESVVYHFAIVFLFLIGEAIVNAFFYENASGLIGGFVIALVIAAVNLGIAVGCGIGFRYKNWGEQPYKAAGWACVALAALAAVYFNALFATFRAEYIQVADPSDFDAVRRAFQAASRNAANIFYLRSNFPDFLSLVLFVAGLLLCVIAFWKGYTSDDPVPHYSRKDRRLKAAVADELQAQDLIRQKVKDFLFGRRTHLQALASEPTALISLTNAALTKVKQARSALFNNTQSVQRDYALVLDAYRQANLAVRGNDPPAYFSTKPSVVESVEASAADPVIDRLGQLVTRLEEQRERYKKPLNESLNSLQNDTAKILDKTYERYIDLVETEAKDNLAKRNVIMRANEAA